MSPGGAPSADPQLTEGVYVQSSRGFPCSFNELDRVGEERDA